MTRTRSPVRNRSVVTKNFFFLVYYCPVAQKGVPPACAHLLLEALVFLKHRVSALFLSELEGNSHRAIDRSARRPARAPGCFSRSSCPSSPNSPSAAAPGAKSESFEDRGAPRPASEAYAECHRLANIHKHSKHRRAWPPAGASSCGRCRPSSRSIQPFRRATSRPTCGRGSWPRADRRSAYKTHTDKPNHKNA